MFFYMSKRIKSMTPSSLSPHYAAQSPSGRKPDLVAKKVLEWWQTNGKHPFIQPHISSPSNVGANSPENLPLGDKVQLIRLPVASPSAVKEFSQVSSEEPAHLTTVGSCNYSTAGGTANTIYSKYLRKRLCKVTLKWSVRFLSKYIRDNIFIFLVKIDIKETQKLLGSKRRIFQGDT
ncbi:hypothetical protein J3Q64DRAFT_1288939 [Phycomyces blakesleeanus]|uniref:Uncharacterized protein n=1 Tax=Phycomyces blakesleeanus TaxID=4837 RepID=A0ABR3ANP7_PHYBL